MRMHVIRERATEDQMRDMLQHFGTFVKLAVDVERLGHG